MQLLMEISIEMDTLSSHIEKTLPIKPLIQFNTNLNDVNLNNNILNNSYSIIANIDKEDLEIKKLIYYLFFFKIIVFLWKRNRKVNKTNELSRNSINNNKKENIKIYEDKGCQSDDEIENDNENNKKIMIINHKKNL